MFSLWLFALLFAGPAHAGNAVDLQATTTVPEGQDPSVTFKGGADGHIDVQLRCGGRTYRLSEDITPRSESTLTLGDLSTGQHSCTGSLSVRTTDGATGEMPLKFQVAILEPIALTYQQGSLDLDAGRVKIAGNRGMQRITVDVFGGEAGERIGGGEQEGFGNPDAEVEWTAEGEVLRIDITVLDVEGTRSRLTLWPWSYAIPHEDVVFPSNQATLTDGEIPKLEEAWGHIDDTLKKYGAIVEMQLYVAGYTDTVGDRAANIGLSQRRARAIAQWFRQRGFTRPIFVQGFGEDVLAVPTADGTDEPANRRALYVLAAKAPAVSTELPKSAWKPL